MYGIDWIPKSSNMIRKKTFFDGAKQGNYFFQPKLEIGPVDDVYEREADAMADQVVSSGTRSIQSKSFSQLQRKCSQCEDDKIQRKENGEKKSSLHAPAIVADVLRSGGTEMDGTTKSFMESRFGYDFSEVKIHNDSAAAKSAQSINALAYTSGNNVVFNNGQFQPGTNQGRRLLAHELTHVIQQSEQPNNIQRQVEVPEGTELESFKDFLTRSGNTYSYDKYIRDKGLSFEIFTSLFHSPRIFKLAGTTSKEVEYYLMRHIVAREGIVTFAANKRYHFEGGESKFHMNTKYWDWGHGKWWSKPDVNLDEARADLNENPEEYYIGCEAATQLTMKGGSKSEIIFGSSSDLKDWVPGDWGYIKNNHWNARDPGLQGENLIYTGNYYFWGHFSDGKTYQHLNEWYDVVDNWNDHGGEISNDRKYPDMGLLP